MKVKDLKVYWYNNFSNYAHFELYIDESPDYSNMRYECRKEHLYYAYDEETGLVSFYYDEPTDHSGFGGRSYELNMKDGSKVILKGPWSSRPEVMHDAGFPLCTSIVLKEDKYKYCGCACEILNSKLEQLIKEFLPDLEYYISSSGEIFIPKNQPLNEEYPDSYAEKRGDREPNPLKYTGTPTNQDCLSSSVSGTQAHIIRGQNGKL